MAFVGNQDFSAELNRLANGGASYPAQRLNAPAAANKWAGTSGYDLLGALNIKAGTSGLALNAVCNKLAGTSNYSAQAALQQVAS